jgi:hypothetical protein
MAHKRDASLPAEALYSSELFFKSRRFAQANFDSWLILSAKYGLLEPGQIIQPYDRKMSDLSADERRELAARVSRQASSLHLAEAAVVSICGEDYDDLLDEAGVLFARSSELTLPIGKKLKTLGERTDSRKIQISLDGSTQAPPVDDMFLLHHEAGALTAN